MRSADSTWRWTWTPTKLGPAGGWIVQGLLAVVFLAVSLASWILAIVILLVYLLGASGRS